MINQTKRLRITDLEAQVGENIWVYNTAVKACGKLGIIVIPHLAEDKQTISIMVPSTWIPINLAEYASKESLLKNSHFFSCLRKGYLALATDAEANAIFEDPEALAEQEHVERMLNQHSQYDREARELIPDIPTIEGLAPPSTGDLDTSQSHINPTIIDIMGRNDNEVSATQKFSTIKTLLMAGLSKENLEYVFAKCDKDSPLARLASSELLKLKGK